MRGEYRESFDPKIIKSIKATPEEEELWS